MLHFQIKLWQKDTCIFWHNNQLLVVHVELQKRNSKQQSVFMGWREGGAKKERKKPCTPAILLWVIVRMVEREVATVSMFENIYFCWTDTDTFYDRKYAVTASTAMVATLHKPTHNGNWVSFVFFMHESFVYRCWYIFQKKIIRRAYTHTHSRQIFRIFEHLLYECLCVCKYCLRILLMCVYLYQKQNFSA